MSTTEHKININYLKVCENPRVLIDSDFSFQSSKNIHNILFYAIFDSNSFNTIDQFEVQLNVFIQISGDRLDDTEESIILKISPLEITSIAPQLLAERYANKIQNELITVYSDNLSDEESKFTKEYKILALEKPMYWAYNNNRFNLLSAIDSITSDNHKFLFAVLSNLHNTIDKNI